MPSRTATKLRTLCAGRSEKYVTTRPQRTRGRNQRERHAAVASVASWSIAAQSPGPMRPRQSVASRLPCNIRAQCTRDRSQDSTPGRAENNIRQAALPKPPAAPLQIAADKYAKRCSAGRRIGGPVGVSRHKKKPKAASRGEAGRLVRS